MTIQNPFANALITFDHVDHDVRSNFIPSLREDWDDLESNVNDIEHEAITDTDEATAYAMCLGELSDESDQLTLDAQRQFLQDCANAWTLISPLLPADDDTDSAFGHISTGQPLSSRDFWCQWDRLSAWELPTFDTNYQIAFAFRNGDYEDDFLIAVNVINHQVMTLDTSS